MNPCEEVLARLDDYVDRELNESEAQTVAAHLEQCPDCHAEETALRGLLREAARLPKNILPQRDLWPEIQSRIEGRVAGIHEAKRRWTSAPVLGQAIGFAAMVAVVAGLMFLGRSEGPMSPNPPGKSPVQTSAAEQEFLDAKAALLVELEASRDSLSAETIATVEESLTIMEEAVHDVHLALADEPDNPQLERMLMATYKSQVDMLRQAVILANED